MGQHEATVEAMRRYAAMAESLLPSEPGEFVAEAEGPGFVQVERGAALGLAMRGWHEAASRWLERPLRMAIDGQHIDATVIDRKAHYRPLYRGMLLHGAIHAFSLSYEAMPRTAFGRWEEGLRAWSEALEPTIAEADVDAPRGGLSAALGGAVAEAAWGALALHAAGKLLVRDAWTDLASDFFGRLTRAQQASGQYLLATAADGIEALAYHELAVLHAAAGYAARAEDRHVAKGVRLNTEYHLENTQPDHATNQPFGLFAFIWNERTRMIADGMLHALQTLQQGPGGPAGVQGVTGILLADTVLCLKLFM